MGIPQKTTRTKTRRRLRDIDQICEDIKSPKHLADHKSTKDAEDLPGLGEFYCVQCAKWFESEHAITTHRKGSTHKRQVKAIKMGPYTQKDAEAAIGMTTDNGPLFDKTNEMEVDEDNAEENLAT